PAEDRFIRSVHSLWVTPPTLDAHRGRDPAPSPLNGERAGVRGEKARCFEFPRVRFMESPDLRIADAHWGHKPILLVLVLVLLLVLGRRAIFSGCAAKEVSLLTSAPTRWGRFMGSFHLLMHANWGHEPTRKSPLTPSPSPIGWERVAAR